MERGRILLASGSPRRRWLLEAACFDVVVRPSDADETWPGGPAEEGVVALARRKLASVEDEALRLAADTIVVVDDIRLGKPSDSQDAHTMLAGLAGRRHVVITGFCVARGRQSRERAVTTEVWFRPISRAEISRYVDTGEPLDKAGAYAIQGGAGAFVDRLVGSYTNVIGLPLAEVIEALEELS